jgi:hypothetical protein
VERPSTPAARGGGAPRGDAGGGTLAPLHRLALVDLYFMSGRVTKAAAALAAIDSGAAPGPEMLLWGSWMDFSAGRAGRARRTLMALRQRYADDAIVRARTQLTLAWQSLLRGQPAEAAVALGEIDGGGDLPGMPDHVQLLKAQSLMWAGDLDTAARELAAVETPSLLGDAARDLAWIRFRRDTGESTLRVPWTQVLRLGPRVLRRAWQHAYRERPRGQDPTVFLSTLADRNAARDAEALIAAIEGDGLEDPVRMRGSAATTVRTRTLPPPPATDARFRAEPTPGLAWLLGLGGCAALAVLLWVDRRSSRRGRAAGDGRA